MASQQFCTFQVADLFFGIEVLQVQEVIRSLEMTRVPLAPPCIEGLINLRGQIVTAIDLRTRLGLPIRENEEPPMNVVVRTDDGALSLLVDAIGDVIETNDEAFERPPETLPADARQMIRGVYKLPGRLLLILDIVRATSLETAGVSK
ncbi:MAG: chemotaxis protein CheW [Gemmatimonadales bacterium]